MEQTTAQDEHPTPQEPRIDWSSWRSTMAEATRSAHRQLDRHPQLRVLTSPTIKQEEYQRALLPLRHVWADFARQFGWAKPIASAARGDLHPDNISYSHAPTLPPLAGAQADAWQYVMWGSTQGGRFLFTRLQQALPQVSHAFFSTLASTDEVPFMPQHPAEACVPHAIDAFMHWIAVCEYFHDAR